MTQVYYFVFPSHVYIYCIDIQHTINKLRENTVPLVLNFTNTRVQKATARNIDKNDKKLKI